MSTSQSAYLAGRLLVAMPGIDDPRFERAVIFVCRHDAEHAMGFSVNRPVDGLTFPRLLKQLGVATTPDTARDPVLMGGPVEQERGFVLHTDDYQSDPPGPGIAGGFALTQTRDLLVALANSEPHPRRWVLALGYAGWDAGQLEREIRDSVWLTCEADEALIFGDDHEHKWSRALAKIGISAGQLSTRGGRA